MTETIDKSSSLPKQSSAIEEWFDDLISTLRSHQVQLETSTANPEIKKLYESLFIGNANELAHFAKSGAQKHFVSQIIFDYIKLIKGHMPEKLAFDYNDSEVLVWAEVKDESFERSEKELLKAEAQINALYHQYGFDMETTIVEAGDKLTVPNHYKSYKA